MNEKELDQILDLMKTDDDPAAAAEARERVWQRLSASDSCAQYRELFPAFRDGTLSESKRMLLDDHLLRCPACRKALQPAEEPASNVVEMPARRGFRVPRWAIAAGVVVLVLGLGRNKLDEIAAPAGARASVKQVDGSLFAEDLRPLSAGAQLAEGQLVRTGGSSRAVLELADGSLIEVNERTELAVTAKWSGQTVRLDRGDVIVRAAKQRRGSLHVVTRDSEAAVKGTIFTVSAGTAGSLVGVVEGAVEVKQGAAQKMLRPGEQSATSASLEHVTVREAVSWSAERDQHFALLKELASIQQRIAPATVRTQPKLVSLLPDRTQFYAAIPNLGPSMQQAVGLIEERSRQVEVLRDWWTSERSGHMRLMVDQLQSFSSLIGDEIVFIFAEPEIPAVIAEVKAGQQSALEAKIKELLPADAGREVAYKFVGNAIVISRGQAKLDQIVSRLGRGAGTPFANEITRRYARGVAWIFGADIAAIPVAQIPEDQLRFFGADNARFLFMEQRAVNGTEENEASLTFAGPRKGMAAWLAAPGSSGSAEYVTSDAIMALSAATRTPKQIFDEIAGFFPGLGVESLEARIGMNLTGDLAAALGTDFTFAVETPSVPIPGWIAAVEVYRPAQVTDTLRRAVEAYNQTLAAQPDSPRMSYKAETVNGREFHSISLGSEMLAAHWTFDRGYWLLSFDRATILRAIQTRAGGFQLIRSERFRSQIPSLAGTHFSGFLWLNLEGAGQIPGAEQFVRVTGPSLLTFTGEAERIQAASRTRIGNALLDVIMNSGPNLKATKKRTRKA